MRENRNIQKRITSEGLACVGACSDASFITQVKRRRMTTTTMTTTTMSTTTMSTTTMSTTTMSTTTMSTTTMSTTMTTTTTMMMTSTMMKTVGYSIVDFLRSTLSLYHPIIHSFTMIPFTHPFRPSTHPPKSSTHPAKSSTHPAKPSTHPPNRLPMLPTYCRVGSSNYSCDMTTSWAPLMQPCHC